MSELGLIFIPPGLGPLPIGSGQRYQILSHVFGCCTSQKTHADMQELHVKQCKKSVTKINHIPRETAYLPRCFASQGFQVSPVS